MNAYYLLAAMICLLIVFIAVTVWNARALNTLKQLTLSNANNIQDSKYYELKYHIQLLVGIFTVLVTICTTVVYSSISAAKVEIKNQLTLEADSARERIRRIEPQLKKAENTIEAYNQLVGQFKSLENNIRSINSKNILKQSYYIVPGVVFKLDNPAKEDYQVFEFKNLRTNTGDRLPEFKNPPMIIPVPNIPIFDITTTSFKVSVYGNWADGDPLSGASEFSVLVLEK